MDSDSALPCAARPHGLLCGEVQAKPLPGRDEGALAKLSEDKEDLDHVRSQKQDSWGPSGSVRSNLSLERGVKARERSLTWLRSPSSLMTKQLVKGPSQELARSSREPQGPNVVSPSASPRLAESGAKAFSSPEG